MQLTRQIVMNWLTDPGVARDGDALARPDKWPSLGCADNPPALWGQCQGSGRDPYKTQIDLSGAQPAYRCNCPSRKFPCKHAAGLMLLFVSKPEIFPRPEMPEWVAGWLNQRAVRNAPPAETPAPQDAEARAKRIASRESKVSAGLQDLDLWLGDLVRGGLAAAASQPPDYWLTASARLIDAQVPGIARRVRMMGTLITMGDQWPPLLLDQIGKLRLLITGYERLEHLPEPVQADIRAQIGFTEKYEDVLKLEAVRDHWFVAGSAVEEEDRLKTQRTWLIGYQTGRSALILDFAFGGQPLDSTLIPGTGFDADLAFFSGSYPLRALIKARHSLPSQPDRPLVGYSDLTAALDAQAQALARNPWIERFPMLITGMTPYRGEDQSNLWLIRDRHQRAAPISSANPLDALWGWRLLAISGGKPITVFGEWDGRTLTIFDGWIG